MSVAEETYTGEVIGCDVGDISLQIHLPLENDDEEEIDDDHGDDLDKKPLLSNYCLTTSNVCPIR